MIQLIINEFKKIGLIKIILSHIIFLIVIIFIYEFNHDMKDTIYKLIPFVGIMTSILFSGIISNEIEQGTFRFYLTKPISRKKVFQSKLLTIIIYNIGLLTYIFYIYMVLCKNIDKYCFVKYVKYSSSLLIIDSLIILLSTIIRNTSVTVGITISLLTFGLLITQLLFDIKMKFIEYTFLPYLDFSIFDDKEILLMMNRVYNINLSLKNGVIINIVYSYLFYIIGNNIFIKKDIKN